MPKPLSRIQLACTRFCPPPAPAKASAPSSTAKPSTSTGIRGRVTTWGRSAQASAPTAKIAPTTKSSSTAATLSICARSRAT